MLSPKKYKVVLLGFFGFAVSVAILSLLFHFYYLFPNSHILFQFKHNHFEHLEFYTDKWDYERGESIQLYGSVAPGQEVWIKCYAVLRSDTLFQAKMMLPFQRVDDKVSENGTNWKKSLEILVPKSASTGWYIISLETEKFKASSSIFICPQLGNVEKRVALLLSTNTWNAYNFWGGQSLYSRNKTPIVSFLRPQLLADPFIENTYVNQQLYYQAANIDLPLAKLLQDNTIEFDVYPIEELHRSSQKLQKYGTLIFSTHPEYWTRTMFENLNTCLDSGASVINLGGNTAAWYSHLDLYRRNLEVDKVEENMWKYHDSTGLRPFALQETAYGFHTFGPYEVLADTSFVWAGTNLKKGAYFGEVSETYDYAYAHIGIWELLLSLTRKGQKGAAAGMELDKVYWETPKNWVELARGWNQEMQGTGKVLRIKDVEKLEEEPKGADMGYYIHPGGGIVFETGSLAFTGAIPYDADVRQIVLNVVKRGTVDGRR